MDEDLIFLGSYIKCITQILIIDFNFSEKDIYKLFDNVIELSNTSLSEYLELKKRGGII